MGADNWNKFDRWKDYQEILSVCELIVYPRKGSSTLVDTKQFPKVHVVDAPEIELSSTFIRQALRDKKDVRFFIPEPIRELLDKAFIHSEK